MSAPKVDPESYIRDLRHAIEHLRKVERSRRPYEYEHPEYHSITRLIGWALRNRREQYERLKGVVGEETATVFYHHFEHNSYTGED